MWAILEEAARDTARALEDAANAAFIPIQVSHIGSMFGFFFSEEPVTDWDSASRCDREQFARFFRAMLERGVYLAPSAFEAGFVSTAHGAPELDQFRTAARASMLLARG
jgi:glutamate-1-semialdehyde 2,1-aminomutase